MVIERFLILDDNATNTLFFEVLLKDLGYTAVFTSPTGDDALEIANKHHIQFVICAWELNGMPGTLFIQKLQAKKKHRFIPCIIYSKRMDNDDVTLTQDLGFKNILAMPFERDSAKEMIQHLIHHENNLNPLENRLRKMEMCLANGQPTEAFKLMSDDLFQNGPFMLRALMTTAEIFLALSKNDRAEKCIADALRQSPNNNKALQLQAKLHSKRGNHEEAIRILETLAANSPKNLTNKIKLGTAYIEAERVDDAKLTFEQVLDIDPDNQDCKDQMAVVAFQEGELQLAEQLIAETESGNELARIFNNMAISQVAKGNHDIGIVSYRNAMRLLADKARLHLLQYNLGLALRKKESYSESLQSLAESYCAEPRFEKAYVAVARIVKEMKEKGFTPDKSVIDQVKKARQRIKSNHAKSA
jgi:tetratricopeptide (TPR) repeat protein